MKKIRLLFIFFLLSDVYYAQKTVEANIKTNKQDTLFQKIVDIGKKSQKQVSQYNILNVQNQFDFTGKPLTVLKKYTRSAGMNVDWKLELETIDNFLKGGDSLTILLKKTQAQLASFPETSLDNYYKYLNKFSEILGQNNRLVVSTNYKYFDNLREMGRVNYETRNISTLIISPGTYSKKLENKLTKLLNKNKAVIINKTNYVNFLRQALGVNIDYLKLFELNNDLIAFEKYYSKFFISLDAPSSNCKNLTFIGFTENGSPSGFGLLINPSKQLILCGFWDDSFPILLYSVNTYYNSKKDEDFYRYIVPQSTDGEYPRRKIDFHFVEYKDTDFRTFNIYIGECDNNNNGRVGFGCFFYEDFDKEKLFYYQGKWNVKGEKHGEGMFYNNGFLYNGNYSNGELVSGTLKWPDKKTTYKGSFKNSKMHGMGKKVNADGTVQEGLFENGSFSKSKAQLEKEQKEKEEENERRLAQLAMEQKLREEQLEAKAEKEAKERVARIKALEAQQKTRARKEEQTSISTKQSNSGYHQPQLIDMPCEYCNKEFNKPRHGYKCRVESEKITNPGFILCSDCFGYGYKTTNIGCDCDFGWCYEKDCHVWNCEDGWRKCYNCDGKGKVQVYR